MSDYEVLPNGNIRVPLPQEHWAEVRTVDDLRQADVRAILRQADDDGIDLRSRMGFDTLAALQEATVARMVRRWSLVADEDPSAPLPVTAESVRGLRVSYYRPLQEATAPVFAELMPGDGDVSADPKSGPGSSPLVVTAG